MKPEMMMKLRTKRLMPVDIFPTRNDSRAPRTNTPVGKMECETFQDNQIKSIETEGRLVVARG